MRLNDKESYRLREKLLDVAYKGVYEPEELIIPEDGLTPSKFEKTGEIFYKIAVQINGQAHDVIYDDEKTRDADFDLVSEAIAYNDLS